MTPRLREKYKNEIIKSLMSKLNLKNSNAVPKIEKIVLNMGLGADALDKKKLETCIKDMASITGQYPLVTRFKKSISRQGCLFSKCIRQYIFTVRVIMFVYK